MSRKLGKTALVTGGAGFIGSNLVDRLAGEGHDVVIYDSLVRPGVERNVDWLHSRHGDKVELCRCDIRDSATLAARVRSADVIFHFAAQVAVTSSLVDPVRDFEVNALGTFNLLEAVRRENPSAPIIFASTNKVYGDLSDVALEREGDRYVPIDADLRDHGIDEGRGLDFHTPYGCSKGAADQYVLDYARHFGLKGAVLRMSCIYGQRQLGTEDQGWVAHFLLRALAGAPITIYGDGLQVRDILDVSDAVTAYQEVWRKIDDVAGQAFNLGGGPENAVSLVRLLRAAEQIIGRGLNVRHADWRPGDQRYFVADARRLRDLAGLPKPKPWSRGLIELVKWLSENGVPRGVAGAAA